MKLIENSSKTNLSIHLKMGDEVTLLRFFKIVDNLSFYLCREISIQGEGYLPHVQLSTNYSLGCFIITKKNIF